ncbi:MAG: HAD family acid phosphatase [Terracidiphilus sp.]
MKKKLAPLAALLVLVSSPVFSAGQQSIAGQPVTKTVPSQKQRSILIVDSAAERIPNLDVLKKEIRQYHDCTCKCGCYAHDMDVQADRAIAFLRYRVTHRRPGERLAMVLDIDETTLSNYQELRDADFAYYKPVFDAWVGAAKAPAIPSTLRLYKEAQHLGVNAFFITGRPESQRAVTERNLSEQGFQNWQQLILRPSSTDAETAQLFKSASRAQIVAQGYKIVLNVGDQWSDLNGKPEAEFSVKYPDPFYFLP